MLSQVEGSLAVILSHMRNAQVADGVRAQLDLHLDRVRRTLGFDVVFVARVAGGERRIEALSAGADVPSNLSVGHICAAGDCPIVLAAIAEDRAAFAGQIPPGELGAPPVGVVGVALLQSNGGLFGALGGTASRPVDPVALRECATVMAVGLDLLSDHARAAQNVRGLIHDIIHDGRFHPVFQPVHDLDTGGIIYREGLTRLDAPDGTTVPELLAAAHSVGMGPTLELAFARAILAADRDWPDDAGLAVNLSETTLHSDEFARFLAEEAEPGLTIELTEHEPVRDYRALAAVVGRMRAAGLMLAIDDAGAGYTSLRHILDLKPDVLKMDAGLSARVDTDPEALALFRFLQRYCDETGTLLVIEGVERPEQLEALRVVGVRFMQGYHLGVPARETGTGAL